MPETLHLTKDNLDTTDKRSIYTVGILGCSRKAIVCAIAFAEAGFKVKCTDADQAIIKRLAKGSFRIENKEAEGKLKRFVRAEQITVSSDLKAVAASSDLLVVTVGAKIDDRKRLDASEAESMCKQVGSILPKGCLVIYAGLSGFGFTEDVVIQTLENTSGLKAGEDFGLAYTSFRENVLQETSKAEFEDTLVAANDRLSLNAAAAVVEVIGKCVPIRFSEIRKAELVALFTAAKRDLNIALINELAIFCKEAGIDFPELSKTTENNPQEELLPTIAVETNRNETYMLLESADNLNVKLRLPALARQVNEDMVRYAVSLTQEALRVGGKPLRRAKVAVLGNSLEADKAILVFKETLEAKGAKVTRLSPYGSGSEDDENGKAIKRTLNETVEGTDCVVIISKTEQVKRLNLKKLRALMKSPAAFVDLASLFEAAKVEEAGFTYRGLGRGVWKK